MRRLYGSYRRSGGALVRHAGVGGRQAQDRHARRPRQPAEPARSEAWAGATGVERRPPVLPSALSSYIAIAPDGTVIAYYGKIDSGQGLESAIAQLVAEEIDVPWARVRVVMGDSALTVNMGGSTAGNAIRQAGPIMRQTAAEARRLKIKMATKTLGVPPHDVLLP